MTTTSIVDNFFVQAKNLTPKPTQKKSEGFFLAGEFPLLLCTGWTSNSKYARFCVKEDFTPVHFQEIVPLDE